MASEFGDSIKRIPVRWEVVPHPIRPEIKLGLGPWRSWSCGSSLALTKDSGPDVWCPKHVSTRGFKEEALETLLFLNLRMVWEDFHLSHLPKNMRHWAGADLAAVDVRDVRHVFEVKYGASPKHVVDQALAYALDVVADSAPLKQQRIKPQGDEARLRFIACRLAAFLTNTRAQTWSLSAAKRDWDALRELLAKEASTITVEELRELARLHERAIGDERTAPKGFAGVHIHLVVPDPFKIAVDQICTLGRLKWRGVQASLWQVALERQGERLRLAMRECWIPPIDPEKSDWCPQEDAMPTSPPTAALLAAATRHHTDLVKLAWSIDRFDAAEAELGPSIVVERRREDGSPGLSLRLDVEVDTAVKSADSALARQTATARYHAVAEWILRVAPPPEPEMRARVEGLRRSPKGWDLMVQGVDAKAWHSSGLAKASISWPGGDPDRDAAVIAAGVAAAQEIAAKYAEAFVRGED